MNPFRKTFDQTQVLPVIAAVTLIVVIFLLLAGCATSAAPPQKFIGDVKTIPEPPKIVVVPCLTREQVPMPPETWMRPDKNGDFNELAAAADIVRAKRYMVTSQTAMWGCVKSFDEVKP